MKEPSETEFLIRRIGQLWAESACLPETSAAQQRIESLACELSDYVSALHDQASRANQRRSKGTRRL
jgi:hypothetical protein